MDAINLDQMHQQGECEHWDYEDQIIEEARAIVEGKSMKLASKEHLQVLLYCLDGFTPNIEAPAWDGNEAPF